MDTYSDFLLYVHYLSFILLPPVFGKESNNAISYLMVIYCIKLRFVYNASSKITLVGDKFPFQISLAASQSLKAEETIVLLL